MKEVKEMKLILAWTSNTGYRVSITKSPEAGEASPPLGERDEKWAVKSESEAKDLFAILCTTLVFSGCNQEQKTQGNAGGGQTMVFSLLKA